MTFLETFKNKKNKPALVLKSSGGGASIMDRDSMLEKIDAIRDSMDTKDIPNIYLLTYINQNINAISSGFSIK